MTDEQPLLVPIAEAARLLGCCRKTLYHMEQRHQLRIVRPFNRAMVPMSELQRIERGEPMRDAVGEPVGEPVRHRIKKIQLCPMVTAE